MTPEQAKALALAVGYLTETRRQFDEQWAQLMEKVLLAAREPTHAHIEAVLDAEYALTGDCDGTSPLADALGYDDELEWNEHRSDDG